MEKAVVVRWPGQRGVERNMPRECLGWWRSPRPPGARRPRVGLAPDTRPPHQPEAPVLMLRYFGASGARGLDRGPSSARLWRRLPALPQAREHAMGTTVTPAGRRRRVGRAMRRIARPTDRHDRDRVP